MSENNTDTNNNGGNNDGANADAWRAPLEALAGDNAEYKTLLGGFKAPEELFSRLKPADPPDWRTTLAGEDADAKKLLERFTDGKAFVDSFKQKDAYINSGKKVTVPGENASAEEIAAWNNARGVPEKPTDYQITAKPPEGVEIDEGSKTMLSGITERLHKLGAEPAVVNEAHAIVYEQLAQAQTQHETMLTQGPERAKAELGKVWKTAAELKENGAFAAAGVQQYLGPLDGERAKALLNIETTDGFFLGDHPAFAQLMAAVGRATAEDPLFLEANGGSSGNGTVEEQIAEIMNLRATDPKKYNAPETRARHEKLLAARARHKQLQGGHAA